MKTMKLLFAAVAAVMMTGELFAWNAKRTMTELVGVAEKNRFAVFKQSIDAAKDGDWLEIPAGQATLTFTNSITLTKSIKLTYGDAKKLLVFYSGTKCRHFDINANDHEVAFEGFDFQNGKVTNGYGGAIRLLGGELAITRCRFYGNYVDRLDGEARGGAIDCSGYAAKLVANDCEFTRNYAESDVGRARGGAVYAYGVAVFNGCSFKGNSLLPCSGYDAKGGAVYAESNTSRGNVPTLVLNNCVISENDNAIHLEHQARAVICQCAVVNNGLMSSSPEHALTVEYDDEDTSSIAYVIGSVFYGNKDTAGNTSGYQGMAKSAEINTDWTCGSFNGCKNENDMPVGVVNRTTWAGSNIASIGSAAKDVFWSLSYGAPFVANSVVNGITRRVCAVKPNAGKFIWHDAKWTNIGCGSATKPEKLIWGAGTLASLTVLEDTDSFGKSRSKALTSGENQPGAYCCQDGASVLIKGNGGKNVVDHEGEYLCDIGEYLMPCQTCPKLDAEIFWGNDWKRAGYYCVGFTNSFTGADSPVEQPSPRQIGFTYANPAFANTIYCKWAPNAYTVKFDANGGTGTMPSQVMTNGCVVALKKCTLTRADHVFLGWAKKSDAKRRDYADTQWVRDVLVSEKDGDETTLYAVWMSKEDPVVYGKEQWITAIQNAYFGSTVKVHADGDFYGNTMKISKDLTIENPDYEKGEKGLVKLVNSGKPLFTVAKGCHLNLKGLDISSGTGTNAMSGAIVNDGRLSVAYCYFHDCRIDNQSTEVASADACGGAINNSASGWLDVTDSTFKDNGCVSTRGGASGGAIYNCGTAIVQRVSMICNYVRCPDVYKPRGGAIFSSGDTAQVVIDDSTIARNTNAVFLTGGKACVVHSVIVDNRRGGGSYTEALGIVKPQDALICNSLVVGNNTGSGSTISYTGTQVYISTNGVGAVTSYGSVVGTSTYWRRYVAIGDGPASYQETYDPSNYFKKYDVTTGCPFIYSEYVRNVNQYYYPLIDDVRFLGREEVLYKMDWSVVVLKDAEGKERVVFPTTSTVAGGGVFESDNYDQLGVSRSSNADETRRYVVGSLAVPKVTGGYRVCFHRNGGTGTMSEQVYELGKVYKLGKNNFTLSGKTFAGWACSNGKRYEDQILIFDLAAKGETVTMTAIWE